MLASTCFFFQDGKNRRLTILWDDSHVSCIPLEHIYLECFRGKDRNAAKNSKRCNTNPCKKAIESLLD